MEFGICHLNGIAIRKDPSDHSEMVSQLLFGETFHVLQEEAEWIKIHMDFDFYEGWVLTKQVIALSEETYNRVSLKNQYFSDEMVTFINDKNEYPQILTLGATLPEFKNGQFSLGGHHYDFDGDVINGQQTKIKLVHTAYKFLNAPFLWGGRTPFGVDCSGFTQMVYKMNGHQLFRDAHQQASQGEVLSFIEECEPGDLAFFDNEEGEIIHTGIVLDRKSVV